MNDKETYKVQRNDKGTGWKTVTVAEFDTMKIAEDFIRNQFDYHGQDNGKLFSVLRPSGWSCVPACAISIKATRRRIAAGARRRLKW